MNQPNYGKIVGQRVFFSPVVGLEPRPGYVISASNHGSDIFVYVMSNSGSVSKLNLEFVVFEDYSWGISP